MVINQNILAFVESTDRATKALIVVPLVFLLPIVFLGWLWLSQVAAATADIDKRLAGLTTSNPVLHLIEQLASDSQISRLNLKSAKKANSSSVKRIVALPEFADLDSIIQHSHVNRDLALSAAKRLLHQIGNFSKLYLDDDQTTHHLSIIYLMRIPDILVDSARVLSIVKSENGPSATDLHLRIKILQDLGALSSARSSLLTSYRTAVDGTDNPQDLSKFKDLSITVAGALDRYISAVEVAVGYNDDVQISSSVIEDVEQRLGALRNHATSLSAVTYDSLNRLLISRQGHLKYSRNLAILLSTIAALTGLVLVVLIFQRMISRYDREIVFMAHHDELTGLSNRKQFNTSLSYHLQRVRRGASIAVHYLDLDKFKFINDTLGHPAGDKLLKAVAQRLRENTRATDIVARLGGDEFAIIQVDSESAEHTGALAERLIRVISAPYDIDGQRMEIGASIGVALTNDEALDHDLLLRQADMALYRSKSEGRGKFHFFEQEMDDAMLARRELETALKAAIVNQEFVLHYQPLVSVSSRAIVGFEALIRWHHPSRGLIGPDQFIPLAEESGLIISLGDWVIQKACEEAISWPSHIRVAINLSPIQLNNPLLIRTIDRALESTGLDPHRLDVEITESIAISQSDATRMILDHISKRGIKISMDDFGTGYTSLGVLQSMPFNHIKIDRSFIRNLNWHPERAVIVRAISDMAGALGMKTTAEGIETYEELMVAQRNGCGEAQGYLFSKPCPSNEIPALLKKVTEVAVA